MSILIDRGTRLIVQGITGRDGAFHTRQMLDYLRRHGAEPRTLELACGHYSLELPPFSYIAGYCMLTFFLEGLA